MMITIKTFGMIIIQDVFKEIRMTDRFKEALDVRYSVIKNPRSTPSREWCVIDKKGEAELGNWVIAECTFYDFADLICRAINLATEAEQLRKENEQLKVKLERANNLINKVFKYDEYGTLHIGMADLEMIELFLKYKTNAPEKL